MRFVWITAAKDWRRHRRDPVALLMWLGIPLLIGTLLVSIGGGRGGPHPQAHVLVADEDDSFVSGLLSTALTQDAMGGLIRTEDVSVEDGRARMGKGDATALLIIPAGFGDAVLMETPTELRLLTNPSQSVLPDIVEEVLSVLVDGVFYIQRVFGKQLRTIASGTAGGGNSLSNPAIAELSIGINETMERMSGYLFPPVIGIDTETDESGSGKNPSMALLFFPGILFMSLLFMSQGLAGDLWKEREYKTLRRAMSTPRGIVTFLLGKVVAGAGIVLAVAVVVLTLGYAYFRLEWTLLPLAVAWTVLAGVLLTCILMVIQIYAPTQRAGGIMSTVIIMPLMMLGGSFFPFEAMPDWLAKVGRFTPNGWALMELKEILAGSLEVRSLLPALAGVLIASAALFMVCSRRLRRGFAQG